MSFWNPEDNLAKSIGGEYAEPPSFKRKNDGGDFMAVPGPDNSLGDEDVMSPEQLKKTIEDLEKEKKWREEEVNEDPTNQESADRLFEIKELLKNLNEKYENQLGNNLT